MYSLCPSHPIHYHSHSGLIFLLFSALCCGIPLVRSFALPATSIPSLHPIFIFPVALSNTRVCHLRALSSRSQTKISISSFPDDDATRLTLAARPSGPNAGVVHQSRAAKGPSSSDLSHLATTTTPYQPTIHHSPPASHPLARHVSRPALHPAPRPTPRRLPGCRFPPSQRVGLPLLDARLRCPASYPCADDPSSAASRVVLRATYPAVDSEDNVKALAGQLCRRALHGPILWADGPSFPVAFAGLRPVPADGSLYQRPQRGGHRCQLASCHRVSGLRLSDGDTRERRETDTLTLARSQGPQGFAVGLSTLDQDRPR